MMEFIQHWRLARRVPDLLDDALAASEGRELRGHVGRCTRCARRLDRIERSETLLARMPQLLFPLEVPVGVDGDARLATLAEWGHQPATRTPYGPMPAASALAMVCLVLVLSVTAQDWGPVVGDMGASTTVAMVMPDSAPYPLAFR